MPVRARLKHPVLAERLARSQRSQNAWAQRLGVSSGYLSMMVNGRRCYPGGPLRNRLLKELQMDFEELFEVEGDTRPGQHSDTHLRSEGQFQFTFWRWTFRVGISSRPPSSDTAGSGGSKLLQDLLFSLRLFYRRKGFSAIAILTIALGIGMSSAMFSILKTVLLDPLPYPDPERLVRVFGTLGSRQDLNVSPLDFQDWQQELESFQGLAGFSSGSLTILGPEGAELHPALSVTPEFFPVLGVKPAAGRFFIAEEGQPDAPLRIVLGYPLWRDRFAADPGIVGRPIPVADEAAVVVGVAPENFLSPEIRGQKPDLWLNLRIDPLRNGRGGHWLRVIGRLKPDVEPVQARAELDLLTARLERTYPDSNQGWHTRMVDLKTSGVVHAAGVLWSLMAAVVLVLLIASINLAGLLLSFTLERIRELGVRLALGASFSRITRQLMTESLLLTSLSLLLGLLLCYLVVAGIRAFGPSTLPQLAGIRIDVRVVGFALLACLLTMAVSLVPTLIRLRRLNPASQPRWSGAGLGGFADLVVIAEVALTIAVLIGAGLMGRTLFSLLNTDPGFEPGGVLTFEISLPHARYAGRSDVNRFFDRLLDRIAARSDVLSAGITNHIPLGTGSSCDGFSIENHPPLAYAEGHCAEARISHPGYFQTLQVPLLEGRYLAAGDSSESPPVVVINRVLAEKYWPGRQAIGKRLRWGAPREENPEPWRTIVGVVGNVRQFGVDNPAPPEIHLPPAQYPAREMSFAVRVQGTPRRLLGDIRSFVQEQDPALPLRDVATMEERLSGSLAQRRFNVVASWSFALLAVILAMAGIYGVVSYSTQQRVPEIGVRMALGAGRGQILRLVLAAGFRRCLIGLALGLLLGWRLSMLISDQLAGISRLDPWTYVLGTTGLLLLVGLAAFVPARKATRIDPAEALRC